LQFENASSGCSTWQVAKRDNRERKKHLPNEINDAVKRKKSRNRMLRSLWGKIVNESNKETDNETMKNTACIQRPTNKEIKTHSLLKV
jgi:hypothetical protein